MTRYPENTAIEEAHFNSCGWQQAIANVRREDYSSMWQALSDAAKNAVEGGRTAEGKVLWLLADACSMMLKPASLNEPFAPMMVMEGRRSALPEDYQQDEVQFLSEIYEKITDEKLCARIADIVWLLKKPREPNAAISAIDNYRKIPLTTDSWVRDGRECWDRAIQLCIMLRSGSGDRLRDIESQLTQALMQSTEEDGYLSLWLSELLIKHRLGEDAAQFGGKLESLARGFLEKGSLHRARDYFDAAYTWFCREKNEDKSAEMIFHCAECWVKEAEALVTSDSPSHMVAVSFYESAIHKYRSIPRSQRAKYNVDESIDLIRTKMNESGEKSLAEMGVISSDPIDITEMVEVARKSVSGKPALEALHALSNVYGGASAARIRKFSKELMTQHPLQSLFSATHMARDGRVIAKRPGADLGDGDNEAAVWPEMVKHYVMELGLVVQGEVWPALEVVRQEHRLREADFLALVKQSPIVPQGDQRLVAKALFMGYDNDFVAALHILVPQVESLVRYHLKQAGVKTTHLDLHGIETENGLSTLVELKEFGEIFGEDFSFEVSALFCDQFGPNLRNELAHGLLGYDECQSVHAIYAWWLLLRVVFNTFWNARMRRRGNAEAQEQRAGDA